MGKNSTEKNISQLAVVAKRPFIFNGKRYTPPNRLAIAPSFWREYICLLGCGGCCHAYTLDFTKSEWDIFCDKFPHLANLGQEFVVSMDGNSVALHTIPQHTQAKWCRFLSKESGACGIHKARPYSCQIELIKFRVIREVGYIMKGHYGRKWQMRRVVDGSKPVLCDITQFSPKQLRENDIPSILRLKHWADTLRIETYIEQIIDVLECYDTIDATKPLYINKLGETCHNMFLLV